MKGNSKNLLLSCVLAVFLLMLPGIVFAQEGGFQENFDNEALPGWERSEGTVVENGVLKINPGNFAFKIGDYRDFSLTFDVRTAGQGILFLRFNITESSDNAFLFFEDSVVLELVTAGEPEEIASTAWSGFSEEWTTVKLSNSSGEVSLSVDGELLFSAEKSTEFPAGGGFGFILEGESPAEIDNLSLTPLAEDTGAAVQQAQPEPTATPGQPTQPQTLESFFAALYASQGNPPELSTFAVNLLLSVLFSYILSRVYVHWGSALSNRRRFASNFILITITTTFIILIVRSSVALSLGLVGALSIVRFRAAIKEPEELAYLFFAIGIGIGLGDNQRLITAIAIAVAILVVAVMRLFRGRQSDFNLHLTVGSEDPSSVTLEKITTALKPHVSQSRLVRFDENKRALEASFLVEFRDSSQFEAAKKSLQSLSDEIEITFLDNKGFG